MKLVFCDICGQEITAGNANASGVEVILDMEPRTRSNHGVRFSLSIKPVIAKNGTWNDGDVCKYCVLDTIQKLDDRPKAK